MAKRAVHSWSPRGVFYDRAKTDADELLSEARKTFGSWFKENKKELANEKTRDALFLAFLHGFKYGQDDTFRAVKDWLLRRGRREIH